MQQERHPVGDGVSILLVDDARFTCEMIRRALRSEGYMDVRVATTARDALDRLAERHADIVLADWLMPELDGLALTRRIRQLDEEAGRYTYVMLITARDGMDSLTEAFDKGVDDFISKGPDHQELLARINAAARIAGLHNDLIAANRRLMDLNRELAERDGHDTVTGFGNRAMINAQLEALVRHTQSRGGIGLCGLIRINDWEQLSQRHGKALDDVASGIAKRLRHTTRPLDCLGRLSDDTFAVTLLHDGHEPPHANAFRRTYNALNLRAYKTGAGFLTVTAAMAVASFQPPWEHPPEAEALLALADAGLDESRTSGAITTRRWRG